MKILFGISLLAIAAAAVLAFMARSSLIDSRNEKDSINKKILTIHDATKDVNDKTEGVWKEWKSVKGLAKDEMTAYNVLVRENKELDTKLADLKKEIEEIANKRADMEARI